MTSPKLPEWPEISLYGHDRSHFEFKQGIAALARMEALVEYARHEPNCPVARMRGVVIPRPECSCGLDELLAACERRSGG